MAQSVIGALRVNLGLDSAQFGKGLRDAQTSLQKAGRSMRNIGLGMSAAVTAPLVIAGRDMVRLAGEQQAAMALVTQGVESTGKAAGLSAQELGEMASGLQEISKFGDEDILRNVTAQLLTFTQVTGDEFDRAQQAILDVSTVMGTDLKSTALQLGKALNDPVKGLGALSRSGIQFTDDQKEVIKSMVELGDTAGAQNIILDELAKQFGGQAAAAAKTFDGNIAQLNNTWGDLKEQFGAILIEILPPLIEGLRSLIDWVQGLDPKTKEITVKMGLFAAAVGPVTAALGLLVLGIAAIGAPVAVVIASLTALGALFVAFYPQVQDATNAVIAFGRDALEYIQGLPDLIYQAFANLPARMVEIGREILAGLKAGLVEKYTEVKNSITGFAGNLVDGVKDKLGIKSPSKVFKEIGANIMQGLGDGLAETGDQVGETMSETVGQLSDDISSLFQSVLIQGANFKESLRNLLGSVGGRLLDSGINGLLGLIPGFAGGTNYAPGGLAMVGERGPELVNLPRGSQVIPNHKLGGGGQVINIDARGAQEGVAEQIAAALRRERPGMVQQAVSATYERAREVPIG